MDDRSNHFDDLQQIISEEGKHYDKVADAVRTLKACFKDEFTNRIPFLVEVLDDVWVKTLRSLYAHYVSHAEIFEVKVTEACDIKSLCWLPFCLINQLESHDEFVDKIDDSKFRSMIYYSILEVGVDNIFAYYEKSPEALFKVSDDWRLQVKRACSDFVHTFLINGDSRTVINSIPYIEEGVKHTVEVKHTSISKLSMYLIMNSFNNYSLIKQRDDSSSVNEELSEQNEKLKVVNQELLEEIKTEQEKVEQLEDQIKKLRRGN